VVAFISGEAKRAIVERHASQAGNEHEQIIIDGVFKVTRFVYCPFEALMDLRRRRSLSVTVRIQPGSFTTSSLLSRPSRAIYPARNDLLLILIEQARLSLKEELTSKKKSITLSVTIQYLELSARVSIGKGISEPIHLMRFYCESLLGKMTLQKLARDAQLFVFVHVAEVLEACRKSYMGRTELLFADEFMSLRRQTVEAASVLLQVCV